MKTALITILSLWLLIASSCGGGSDTGTVMSNTQFTVTGDSVIQGRFTAYAPSRLQIVSNYVDTTFSMPTSPMPLRLAFNMRDNEFSSGTFHLADITQDTIRITACRPDSIAAPAKRTISPGKQCTLVVDLTAMTEAFKKRGVYVTAAGDSIFADEFNGVWVLGSLPPLSWNLLPLASDNHAKLRPSDKEGFYELDITFAPEEYLRTSQFTGWAVSQPNPNYPEATSDCLLTDAIYNMAISTISEADFSTLGVSQTSLAAVLTLADIAPAHCQHLLRAKVHNGIIDQDHVGRFTFPIVNDRMVWAAAAWQVYCATGKTDWIKYARKVIEKTLDAINPTIFCDQLYMVHGCDGYSSPESQYPRWAQPKDYFESIKLSTNVTYAYCYYVLSLIDDELGLEDDSNAHYATYQRVKDSINQTMWNEQLGRYCSYLMHEAFPMQSGVTCNIAQAAAMLFGIADDDRATTLLARTPFYPTGIPAIYPSSYLDPTGGQHPYVQGLWNIAAARYGNLNMLQHGMAALIRSVAFCGFGTANTSQAQRLLNACATAAMTIKITAGITILPEGIEFNPVVPEAFPGNKSIKNFRYRNATYDITVRGTGASIESFMLDGKENSSNFIDASVTGHHTVDITLTDAINHSEQSINVADIALRPFTPSVKWQGDSAIITNYLSGCNYSATINTRTFSGIQRVFSLPVASQPMSVVYVTARRGKASSHPSQPHVITAPTAVTEYPLCRFAKAGTDLINGSASKSVVEFGAGKVETIVIDAFTAEAGNYFIDLLYSNGSTVTGLTPISMVWVNTHQQDMIVLPAQAPRQWRTFSRSNMIDVPLLRGHNTIRLQFLLAGADSAPYAHTTKPTVLLRSLRLIKK